MLGLARSGLATVEALVASGAGVTAWDDREDARDDAMAHSDHSGPINLGNPHEIAMLDLARWIIDLTGSQSPIVHIERPVDDPTIRQPDTTLAEAVLGWQPEVEVGEGLRRTIEWFRAQERRHAFDVPPLDPQATEHILRGE